MVEQVVDEIVGIGAALPRCGEMAGQRQVHGATQRRLRRRQVRPRGRWTTGIVLPCEGGAAT
jgi:hypothetical protein